MPPASRPVLGAAFSACLVLSVTLTAAAPALAGDASSGARLRRSAPLDPLEQTVTAGGSSLGYNGATDTYAYVWKTQSGWSGCRKLTLTFADGSVQEAIFQFRP